MKEGRETHKNKKNAANKVQSIVAHLQIVVFTHLPQPEQLRAANSASARGEANRLSRGELGEYKEGGEFLGGELGEDKKGNAAYCGADFWRAGGGLGRWHWPHGERGGGSLKWKRGGGMKIPREKNPSQWLVPASRKTESNDRPIKRPETKPALVIRENAMFTETPSS